MNPKVFIGSSVGNLNLAYAIQTNLEHAADVTVWAQGVFNLTSNALDDLISVLDESDFGIFVFSPQDIVEISNQQFLSVRDNVVFEFGLFIGRMGKERTFFVTPRNQQNFRLPTDLSGVTPATYDPNRMDNLQAALGPACFQMQRAIQNLGVRKNRLKQPDVDQHNKPTILCASSEQYGQFGFDEDVTIIQTAFPEQVSVERI